MKLNFNFSGKTLLKDWWKIVRDNFTAIQTDHNTLSDKLDTEITQRTNADVGLADKITAEKTVRESADSTLQKNINDETKNRQTGDSELQQKISAEITERQTADSKKADKTELYGTDETTKHTITHTLTTSDFVINITSYDTGTVKIPAETVHSKILLNGSPMPAVDVIGTFDCGKSEEDHGDKYVAIAYSPNTGKLDIDVVDIDCSPTDADAIAEINIQYQTAKITKMYHLSHIFYGISSLNDLKTNNKNSFLAAVNEISTKLTTEISDREGAEHSLNEKISTEISDRQAADNELKAKISDINTELTTDNLFYDLSKYVNSDNTLVTDDSGVQYLSYSDLFENGVYLYHNFVVDNFRRKPKTETTLELTFNVASRHIAGDGCDSGGLNIGETDVLITYTDTTTEIFGQSYYTATDTGDKTITINGTSETYKTTKFKIEIPVTKEIKSISFRIVSDNFYTNGDPTGNVCEQETLIQSAVCYDDECVAVLRDDINTNTSKITANTTKITEIDKTVTDIAKHQIFVVCDGDHDELKLQAAISTAPYNSVIYPVGTKCVLTNENTIRGYGLPESSGRAIISLKGSMTLDGSMCDDFIFKNTNPAEKQHIFHISQSTTMKNVKFEEDIKTVTSDTINPIVLFAETESEIVSCSFVNIFSTHQLGVSTFKLGKVLFFNNVINGFEGAPGNVITREISIANYAKIIGNEFLDFTQNKQCLGYMLSASKIFFQDNYIENCENCIMSLGGNIIGNVFSSIENCTINCGGEIIGNTFSSIYQNEDTSFLTNSGRLIGNQFTSIRITGEYVQFIDCSNSSIISDNYMSIASIPATGSCSLISASGRTLILNNSFSTSSSLADNNEFNLLDVDGNTVIKNNVTSAKSFGRIADTCIAEGNITSWS
jgi:hypothetical protein